jgi:uncharacterized protein (UPF0254 family)
VNKEQLLDLTERVKLVAGVDLPVIIGSQSLYTVTSHVPDIVRRSVECDFLRGRAPLRYSRQREVA